MFQLFEPFEGVAAESPLDKFYLFFFYVDNHLLTLNSWIFNATITPPVIMTFLVIGGHGFWDKGGVYTLGVSEKNFAAPSGGNNTWV